MRVDLKKYFLVGAAAKKEEFLSACQKAGIVHFIGTSTSTQSLLSSEFQDVVQAIKVLKQFDVEQAPDVYIDDPVSFSKRVLDDKQRMEELLSKEKTLKAQQSLIEPFGTIPFDQMEAIEASGYIRFRLFMASKKRRAAEKFSQLIEVGSAGNMDYFVSLVTEPFSPSGIEEIQITKELRNISQRMKEVAEELAELREGLRIRASFVEGIKKALVESINSASKHRVSSNVQSVLEDHLFTITVWIPSPNHKEFEELAHATDVYIEERVPAPDEVPPTCLYNKNMSKIGEDLIDIYDVPSHTDKDPSLWVLISFSLFFAMIIGDAGYGLVFLLSALFCRKKVTSPEGKRFIQLLGILGITSVLWGCCIHSFFDIDISPNNILRHNSPLTKLVEKQAQYHFSHHDVDVDEWTQEHSGIAPDSWQQFLYEPASEMSPVLYNRYADAVLLEISLLLGTVHILISIFRYLSRDYSSLGWVFFIIGGYLYLVHYLGAVSMLNYALGLDPVVAASIGLQLLESGLAIAVIGSIIRYGVTGIFEVMKSVQILSDILSYLRLYALGIAGAMIGTLANSCTERLPFIFAAIIIISTHIINIALSVMSGVIHGLRLNFLEWYHYSFEGGGKKFCPLKLETYR
jgi:V/A-type H+-transporting ATPase subunit I